MSRKRRGRRIRNSSTTKNFTRPEVLPRTAGCIELRNRSYNGIFHLVDSLERARKRHVQKELHCEVYSAKRLM